MLNRLKSRRRLLAIPVGVLALAAVAFGALAIGAGGIFADSHPDGDGFAARVADILGLEETEVTDAMTQAKSDMRSEALRSALDAKVAAGDITQEQADEYLEWAESAPDWAASGRFGNHRDHFGRRGHGKKFGRGWR